MSGGGWTYLVPPLQVVPLLCQLIRSQLPLKAQLVQNGSAGNNSVTVSQSSENLTGIKLDDGMKTNQAVINTS